MKEIGGTAGRAGSKCVACHTSDHDRGSRLSCRITVSHGAVPIVMGAWIHFNCYRDSVLEELETADAIKAAGIARIHDLNDVVEAHTNPPGPGLDEG